MKTLLKVLNKDLASPFQGFKFEIGKKYHCEDFCTDKEEDCAEGFYATDYDGLPYAYNINRKVYECQVSGKKVEYNIFKRRYENFKIIREVPLEELVKTAKEKWDKKLGYKLSEVLKPINPLNIQSKKITKEDIRLLNVWDSVRDSVWASVRDSVGDSVGDSVWASVRASVGDSVGASVWDSAGDSVWASVRDSVGDSVGASVWDSAGAYYSSLFPNIKKWKYINHKENTNPFQPAIELWCKGLIPCTDGKFLYLVSKNGIEYKQEITKK